MRTLKLILAWILVLSLAIPVMAKGPGGGGGGGGGRGGPGGGGGDIPDTGTLYGDLYVVLRDENGVPVFDQNGCLQPIAAVEGYYVYPEGATGEDILFETTAYVGEPFQLADYTEIINGDEEVVECELTEAMADWVMTVDFGRLNMGRAPVSVIAHAFDEAINKMNVATQIKLDPAGRLVLSLPTYYEDGTPILDEFGLPVTEDKTIDAPAENLALYIAMMTEGDWITEDTTPIVNGGPPEGMGPAEGDGPSTEPRPVLNDTAIGLLEALYFTNLGDPYDPTNPDEVGAGDLNDNELLLAASLLAAAADKTGSITLDKVVYINFIYGINQLGTLTDGQVDGRTYFDFSEFDYGRGSTFANRGSPECAEDPLFGPSYVWVLQPDLDDLGVEILNHFETQCMDLLGYASDPTYNAVRFLDMKEVYYYAMGPDGLPLTNGVDGNNTPILLYNFTDNVRAFAQAADDALQVIEYIHNYKVPEVLYPEE